MKRVVALVMAALLALSALLVIIFTLVQGY